MKKTPSAKSRKGSKKAEQDKALSEALKELGLAKETLAARDAEHLVELRNLIATNDDLRTNLDDAVCRASALNQQLRAEETHDRQQEINISVLLQHIMVLTELVSQLREQLLRRKQAEAREP